tara:strand:+ start:476 stop:667 length:192 start_codon:yes stop_codon:yes gene_type:complete
MIGEFLSTPNGEMYWVKRKIRESHLRNPDMSILKKFFRCDTILRNGDMLYFCNHIKSIEYEEL